MKNMQNAARLSANAGAANDPAASRIMVAVVISREISMAPSSLVFAVSDDGDGGGPTARAVYRSCPMSLRWVFGESKRRRALDACISRSIRCQQRANIEIAVAKVPGQIGGTRRL